MKYKFLLILFCAYSAAMPSQHLQDDDLEQTKDIAAMLIANLYESEKSDLSKSSAITKDSDDDTTVLVSKLSDNKLLSMLQKQQKQDIIDVLDTLDVGKFESKLNKAKKTRTEKLHKNPPSEARSKDLDRGSAFFRIDDKEVEPFNVKFGADPKYLADQRIKNLLYSYKLPKLLDLSIDDTEENKEILFDILTSQLKKLCCKSNKNKRKTVHLPSYEPLLSIPDSGKNQPKNTLEYEQMFLIINDEIETAEGSEVIDVDPDSLSKNSSVVLLGPIKTPLSDSELHVVMDRITSELSRSEYIPLFQEVSEGKVKDSRLIKSLVSGSNTRRYIKPHRCRTRYPLSQGPKWLVCTGYLNINNPSLYD